MHNGFVLSPTHFKAARGNKKHIWFVTEHFALECCLCKYMAVHRKSRNCQHSKLTKHECVTVAVFIRRHDSVPAQTLVIQLLTSWTQLQTVSCGELLSLACLWRALPEEICEGLKSCKNSHFLSGSGMTTEQ